MVADILVVAGLYASRATAKAAMNYEATGVLIHRPRFDQGTTGLDAIRMICERVNFRFWFSYDGTPNFTTAPAVKTTEDLDIPDSDSITGLNLYQDINEVRNHVTIEGEERSVLNVSTQQVERSSWRGEASDSTSIAAYLEHTDDLRNHLFQDQQSCDAQAAVRLAAFKDPKNYLEIVMAHCALPVEIGDTIEIDIPVVGATTETKDVIVRAISLSSEARILCEIFAPTNTPLTVSDVNFGFSVDPAIIQREGYIETEDAEFAFSIEQPTIELQYEYTTVQSGTEVEVPTGMTQAVIECWGTGAHGYGDDPGGAPGGGGGGGGYSKKTVTVSPGDKLYLYLAAAGENPTDTYVTDDNPTTLCLAESGVVGDDLDGGQGGQASNGTGDTKYDGGDGAAPGTYVGGGGGSSAGTGAAGADGSGQTGGTAPTGGGNGGNGGNRYADGYGAQEPGGGGGGAGEDSASPKSGGVGKIGKIILRYS